ncbi:MAG: flagellar basal body rod protein FlgC [Bacillota bacterium]
MRMFQAMQASASALTTERLRMDLIANNLANINTTRTADGTPYRRRYAVVEERRDSFADMLAREAGRPAEAGVGVRVAQIAEDQTPFKEVYDPTHPHADANGIVRLPNVDLLQEITDMMMATRVYEANLTAFNASKSMALRALEIGR